jgi:hypothetical protein
MWVAYFKVLTLLYLDVADEEHQRSKSQGIDCWFEIQTWYLLNRKQEYYLLNLNDGFRETHQINLFPPPHLTIYIYIQTYIHTYMPTVVEDAVRSPGDRSTVAVRGSSLVSSGMQNEVIECNVLKRNLHFVMLLKVK